MLRTTLSTLVNGQERFLGVGIKEDLPGFHNFRNIYVRPAKSYVNLFRPEWAPIGTVYIGITGLRGGNGQLVPVWGRLKPGRGLVTAYGSCTGQQIRLWKPIAVEGGWHVQCHSEQSLFLSIGADGCPTLSNTPAVWMIPDEMEKVNAICCNQLSIAPELVVSELHHPRADLHASMAALESAMVPIRSR